MQTSWDYGGQTSQWLLILLVLLATRLDGSEALMMMKKGKIQEGSEYYVIEAGRWEVAVDVEGGKLRFFTDEEGAQRWNILNDSPHPVFFRLQLFTPDQPKKKTLSQNSLHLADDNGQKILVDQGRIKPTHSRRLSFKISESIVLQFALERTAGEAGILQSSQAWLTNLFKN
ncbi:hypothetical protein PGT21_015210 [Puccinia graminis f. sp. tritici]|uniref:Uncharacterized protein n=1 Tax=Puccinia graminis f. sp. tritici TaxID=56615 RepID=A0A5B0NMX9_PUCGR|nr:hypothetical protein PGT21_015210 [Puccinia graminis f. sp. tritici]KAA1089874.1 hypothetical protein PGTUg99_025496 [Puccinia graminis f. sp. tritici]